MKRFFSFLLIGMLLMMNLSAAFAQSAWEQIALETVNAIISGRYEDAVSHFTDDFVGTLNADGLRESYEPVKALLGEYWGVHSVEESRHGDVQLVLVRCAYEKNALAFTISFENEKISGMFFQLTLLDGVEGLEYPMDMTSREAVFFREGEWNETAAKLVVPDGEGPFPAVVFLADSGAQDRDASNFELRPFYDIAEGLAQAGIASIRWDKYTYLHTGGMTERELAHLTVQEEYINDALAAVEILKNDPRIGDIYMLGHGQGAMVAPRVIRDAGNGNIAGGILLAGSPEALWQVAGVRSMNALTEEQKESYTGLLTEQLGLANMLDTLTEEELLEKVIFGWSAYYHRDEQSVDAGQTAIENAVPLLIAQGTQDALMPEDIGIEAWEEVLESVRFPVEYKLYEGLDHLLMTEGSIVVAESVISDIAAFILGE